MSTSRSRAADWVSRGDPFGYSPYDEHAKYQDSSAHPAKPSRHTHDTDESDSDYPRRHSHSHSSPRSRRSSRTSYDNHGDPAHKADRGRHHSPKHGGGGGRSRSRRTSAVRDTHHQDHDDSGWDTDYDPRDRFYLSRDDEAGRTAARHHHRGEYTPTTGDDRRRSGHHHEASRGSHSGRHSGRQPLSRRVSSESAGSRRQPSSASASRSSRPRPATRHSSYNGRPRSARYPPNASKSRHISKGLKATLGDGEEAGQNDNAWETAMRSGMKAGAIAALRVSGQKGSLYEKVPRVATAALGAAVVDSLLTARHPGAKGGTRHAVIRQVAELAIGNLVAKPAAKGMKQRRHG